ncbi:MOSC domain-containing protein [Botryobacter ruber]|uniref:MOSC domain-containing protein n=1 Tax=Botryobacter ruber TaxID=2171629 RepID=UPI000E0AB196|nr:MOSC N-terminal beta barrel domain-containing protein [Botryobacter ruber]
MSVYTISEINIYPIKSLGGFPVERAQVEDRGLQYDRRWMLVDAQGNFLTQRQHAHMALLQVHLQDQGLLVTHKHNAVAPLLIPFEPQASNRLRVTVWDDTCDAVEVSAEANDWFSQALAMPARLVKMPAQTARKVDPTYAHQHELVSFADAFPLLLIGQASLDDLNSRLSEPVPMNRFRPNLVFTGGAPFAEDSFAEFKIGNMPFRAAKPCARCVVTTIDQQSAQKSAEPLKTLSTYRLRNNKVMFGQNLLHRGVGEIRVGDKLEVLHTKPF